MRSNSAGSSWGLAATISPKRPRPLALLHGFPDLAYGWRHLLPLLADAGYHVVAPDQRGVGRTTGWVNQYYTPLAPLGLLNLRRDALSLVLGPRRTALLVRHDLGSPVAADCPLARPDVFPAVVLLSAPFPGPPAFPFNTAASEASPGQPNAENQQEAAALAALHPPREPFSVIFRPVGMAIIPRATTGSRLPLASARLMELVPKSLWIPYLFSLERP